MIDTLFKRVILEERITHVSRTGYENTNMKRRKVGEINFKSTFNMNYNFMLWKREHVGQDHNFLSIPK